MADSNASTPSDPYQLTGKTVAHYSVREVLGGGGMGVVYRAEDTRLQRSVALKFLPPAMSQDAESKNRFLAEAQAASALDHPNICTVHEFGETETGQLFIAMAYYAGASLRAKMASGPFSLEETLDYGIQIAGGLSAAHSAGIVHRDIKPANVVVTDGGLAKIVDFGIARVGEAQLTRTGATLGTTAYMSPEQTTGSEVDGRTDIWSLGVVLYECLAGVRPFKGSYDQAIIFSILQEEPESLSSINPDVPAGFEAVINRCLQKEPAARYRNADALLEDLRAIQSGREPERVAEPPKQRPSFGAKKLAIAGFAVVALVSVLLLGWLIASPDKASANEIIQVAMLPFTNVSGDSTDQAFIDGLGYTVSATLTEMEQFVDRLSVIPADADDGEIRSPKDAAESLRADVLVTGSVQRSGTRVRLTLNLFDAEEDRQTRSTIIDSEVTNMLAMQDSVAQVLARLLDVELSASDLETLTAGGTTSPEAFDDYTQGRGYLEKWDDEPSIDLAIEHFQRAIDEDGRYVLAYAALGEAYWRKYTIENVAVWAERASDAASRAVELNSELAPVRVTAGRIYKGTGQYEAAERELLRALELDSTSAQAHQQLASTYYYLGRLEEAEHEYRRAIDLKPGYAEYQRNLGFLYESQGRHEEAIRMYKRALGLRPENPAGYTDIGLQYHRLGNLDSARVWYETASQINPEAIRPTAAAYRNLAAIHFLQRDFDDAIRMYGKSVDLDSTVTEVWRNLAAAYYLAGRKEQAQQAFERVLRMAESELEVNPNNLSALVNVALAASWTGGSEHARRMLGRIEAQPNKEASIYFDMALVYDQIGERSRALANLEEGFSKGLTRSLVEATPVFDSLRADPGYQEVLRHVEFGNTQE